MTVNGGILLRSAHGCPVVGPIIIRNSIFGGTLNYTAYDETPSPELCQWESGSIMEGNVISANAEIHHCADGVDYPIEDYLARCADGRLTGCMTIRDNKYVSGQDAFDAVIEEGAWTPSLGDNWDVSLLADSPAIDAGVASGTTRDFLGVERPQGAAPDAGIYERLGAGGVPPTCCH